MRHALGLDLPLWQQYFHYAGNVLRGDLGRSIFGSQPVAALLLERLPNPFALATTGLLIAIGIGMPLGILAAYRKGSWADSLLMMAAVCGISIPNFWLGLMLLLLFSLVLGWLPIPGSAWQTIVRPGGRLGLTYMAIIARMTR